MHSASTANRARHFGHYLAHAFEKLHHIKHDADEHSKSANHSNTHNSKLERSFSDHSQSRMRSVLLRQLSSENNLYKRQSVKMMDRAPMKRLSSNDSILSGTDPVPFKRLSSNDSITSGTEISASLCQPHVRLRFSDDIAQ